MKSWGTDIGKLDHSITYCRIHNSCNHSPCKVNTPSVPNCMTFWAFHTLRNTINIMWKTDIMSCLTKLSLINNMGKINERIERRESNN